jgi:hypothetical protein
MASAEKIIKDLEEYVNEQKVKVEQLFDENKEKLRIELIDVLEKTVVKLKGENSKA